MFSETDEVQRVFCKILRQGVEAESKAYRGAGTCGCDKFQQSKAWRASQQEQRKRRCYIRLYLQSFNIPAFKRATQSTPSPPASAGKVQPPGESKRMSNWGWMKHPTNWPRQHCLAFLTPRACMAFFPS